MNIKVSDKCGRSKSGPRLYATKHSFVCVHVAFHPNVHPSKGVICPGSLIPSPITNSQRDHKMGWSPQPQESCLGLEINKCLPEELTPTLRCKTHMMGPYPPIPPGSIFLCPGTQVGRWCPQWRTPLAYVCNWPGSFYEEIAQKICPTNYISNRKKLSIKICYHIVKVCKRYKMYKCKSFKN